MTARRISGLTAVIGMLSFTAGVLNLLGNFVSAVFYIGAFVLWILAAYIEIATRPSREKGPPSRSVTSGGASAALGTARASGAEGARMRLWVLSS